MIFISLDFSTTQNDILTNCLIWILVSQNKYYREMKLRKSQKQPDKSQNILFWYATNEVFVKNTLSS